MLSIRMMPALVILTLATCLAETAPAQTRPVAFGSRTTGVASRRLPHSLSPKSLSTTWPESGKQAATDTLETSTPGSLAAAIGLPVADAPANRTSQETMETALVKPVSNTNPHPAPPAPGHVTPVQHTVPFHDFTQLSSGDCGCSSGSCDGSCNGACDGGCNGSCGSNLSFGPEWIPGFAVDHLSIRGGVHGFKNESNRGQDGSFGFQEGFNFGTFARNIILPPTVGLQFGLNAMQSNLEGTSFNNAERNQTFMTVGAFRRATYGLQGGLVLDYLWDDWYYDLTVGQIRGEVSMAMNPSNSYGLWFTANIKDDDVQSIVNDVTISESWETLDIYALFFRTNMLGGGKGEGRLSAGLSSDGDGILGADSRMPLTNGWALETEFLYVIPNEPRGGGGNDNEAWNLAINLVWYPGSLACGQCLSQHRPMFDVATNGSLILRKKP
ncbi:MAG: hypothetical protein KDB23_08720 [Planctomycetales bacterium]|nr:hypothetical protein [Planctomycetales bacterium]